MPPAFLNHSCSYRLQDTDTDRSIFTRRARPQSLPKIAAAPLALPPAVDLGENKRTRPERSELRRFRMFIANSRQGVATTA